MAKMDKEFLLKHHFWLLLGPFLLFALIAWFGLFSEVSSATSEKLDAIQKHQNELKAVQAKPRMMVDLYEKQDGVLKKSKTKMWEAAWNHQKEIYTWPENYTAEQLRSLSDKKFGDEIKDITIRQQFRNEDKYEVEYRKLAEKVAPLQFDGGWRNVLRFVKEWKQVPTSEEMWLALEDFWIQRELVMSVAQVNADAAKFNLISDPNDKLKRKFQSRYWELELSIENQGADRVIKGTIKNRTSRLQSMGIGNRMILHVWTDPDAENPIEFPVEGEFVPGGKAEPVKTVAEHKLDRGARVTEFARVVQVFDGRTVPVKRIDVIKLSYPSSRTTAMALKSTAFSQKAIEAAGATATPGVDPSGAIATPMLPGGLDPRGGAAGSAATTDLTLNGLERKRYVDATAQVRRMPIGMVVVVDQDFMQDILVSLANSKLRFQNTQFHWARFRGQLSYIANDPFSSAPSSPMSGGASPTTGTPEGGRPMLPMGIPRPTLPGSGVPVLPGSGSPVTNRTEDQLSASLVAVSVYGIASLYEPYKTEAELAAQPTNVTPQPVAPMPKPSAPKVNPPAPKVEPKPPVDPDT